MVPPWPCGRQRGSASPPRAGPSLSLLGLSLRSTETPEAAAVLALLRGEDPEPGPRPVCETIMWRGQPKQVYTVAELMAADFDSHTFHIAHSFWQEWEPLLRRWAAD